MTSRLRILVRATVPDVTPSPVVEFDRVTVTYGKQHALRDVGATFMQGAAGLL